MNEENKQPQEETSQPDPEQETKSAPEPETEEKSEKKAKKKKEKYTFTREQVEQMELAAKQLESVKDQFIRQTAEYENYRKRTTKEKEDSPHKKGLDMIFQQYKEILAKLGVEEIEAQGQPFDPEWMNAVMHVENDSFGENTVAQVFQAGFRMGDKVIRHAIVQVAN